MYVMKHFTSEDGKKSDWITVVYEGDFTLIPDIYVTTSYKSALFGALKKEKTEEVRVPKSLSQQEIVELQDYCFAMAVGSLAKKLNINFEWPKV